MVYASEHERIGSRYRETELHRIAERLKGAHETEPSAAEGS